MSHAAAILESARDLPVARQVDIVVAGGSVAAVVAAAAAARQGASVFLAAPRPYLGEDICATLQLWREGNEEAPSDLGRKLFPDGLLTTPLQVKRALDEELLEAGVHFLYSCCPTDLLRDGCGQPAGIIIANRAGRQAVPAKITIDATEGWRLALLAGAQPPPFEPGVQQCGRVVIGGDVVQGPQLAGRQTGLSFPGPDSSFPVLQYSLELPLANSGYSAVMEAEHLARDLTYHEDQARGAERLMASPLPAPASPSPRLKVLAGVEAGERLGRAAADEAAALPDPEGVAVAIAAAESIADEGDVCEALDGIRPGSAERFVHQSARAVPLVGDYDVIVVGGGTSGAAAGIGAARQGARVLVVEHHYELGGVGTLGLIGGYHRGFRGGFTAEVDRETGAVNGRWNVERKAEWWRRELRRHGADVWFGAIACGAYVADGRVAGVALATSDGRGVALASAVIDATGNADVAAPAGAVCDTTSASCVAVQGTGLPIRELGANYTNTDFAITDETDMVDVWQLQVYAKRKYDKGFDLGQLIDTRERRRVVGDFILTVTDQLINRTYPDTIAQCISNLDTHGYLVDPLLALHHPERVDCLVPYRCMLPMGLEGILVTGLATSASRDAIPFIRMQSDLQNQGYAAGVAAAMAAATGNTPRTIDVRQLQEHLVEIGNLPPEALAPEPGPPSTEEIEAAIAAATTYEDLRGYDPRVALLLAHPEKSLPLLRRAYAAGDAEKRLAFAHFMAFMGDAAGIETIIDAVAAAPALGDGYEYRGMGHDHSRRRVSPIDSYILALGALGDRRAVPILTAKLELLHAGMPFSHHYAVAKALEQIADPSPAPAIAKLLEQPGMGGHSIGSLEAAMRLEDPPLGNASRLNSFREIVLARALYRCGDCAGLATSILTAYRDDLRGHFARHARAILQE